MAIIETGLGWYADSSWLTDQTGLIGKITGGTPGSNDITNMVSTVLSLTLTSGPVYEPGTYYLRAYTEEPGAIAVAYPFKRIVDGDGGSFIFCSATRTRVAVAYSTSDTVTPESWLQLEYDQQAGLYWAYFGAALFWNRSVFTLNPDVPIIEVVAPSGPSAAAAAARIVGANPPVETKFAKSSSGYSVTCMCKWKAELSGDVYCSPVLISSVEANTAYTRNSTAISTTTQHTIGSTTFYMRKDTDDVVDGTETIRTDFLVLDLSSDAIYTDDGIFYAIAANAEIVLA